jgi:hypothetical protein
VIDPIDIVRHTLAGFAAAPDEPPTARTNADGTLGVGILHVTDSPVRGVDSWASVEASSFETPLRTPDGRPLRVEFVAAIDGRFDGIGDAVAACVFEINPSTEIRPGTVYRDAVGAVYPTASTPHLMSVAPFVWEGQFVPYSDDDAHVTWLQLVPITDDEADFVAARGRGALEAEFDRAQPDLFSLERRSVLTA